jgi:hypothetical protein
MRCICKNCKHCLEHHEGLVCSKHMIFVHEDDTCEGFENDELFNPTKLVVLAIVVIGIVLLCAKFL